MSDDGDKIIRFPSFERIDLNDNARGFFRTFALINREPVALSLEDWDRDMRRRFDVIERTGRDPWRVAETNFGRARISTVFLGIDHSFGSGGPPLLFETMIFGGRLDEFQNRCGTWDEAEAMHNEAVALARSGHLKVVK